MKTAFIFPGQGSQKLGMVSDFMKDQIVIDTFKKASEILNYDLLKIIIEDVDSLNKTNITQPAILTTSIALYRLWQDKVCKTPDFVAGHSLGEYSSCVASNILDFSDAVLLVSKRGEIMQNSVPKGLGLMAAILGLEDEKVIKICKEVEENQIISVANFNCTGQVVIAGHKDAVQRSLKLCKDNGAKTVELAVSVPSHCMLMKEAADEFSNFINNLHFKDPDISILQNVNAKVTSDPYQIKQNLLAQMYSPVLWTSIMGRLNEFGVENLVECGPSKVLTGLAKRSGFKFKMYSLDNQQDFNKTEESI